MPLVDPYRRNLFSGPVGALPEPVVEDEVDNPWEWAKQQASVWGAAFRTENPIVSTLINSGQWGIAPTEDYDPWQDIAGTQYEADWKEFIRADSAAFVEAKKRQIDREREDRAVMAASPFTGFVAGTAATLLDPTILLPGGALVKGANGSYKVLRTAGTVAALSGVGAAVQEGVLQATQATRTAEEAYMNVGSAIVLGGLFGAVGGALLSRAGAKDAKLLDRFESEFNEAFARGEVVDAGSLSAAAVRTGSNAQIRPASALGLEKFEGANPVSDNPLLRALNSPSPETARLASELAETPYYLKGNAEDVASPIAAESLIKGWQGPLAASIQQMDDQFARYRFGRAKKTGDMLRAGVGDLAGEQKLSYAAFKEEVAKAMRRGDQSAIPEAAAAAKQYRKAIVDPLKDAAIRLGLLPEGVEPTGAASYLTRVYDIPKILERRNAFTEHLTDWFELSQRGDDKLTRAELRAEAEEVVSQILGQSPGRTGYDLVANLRGPLKERTLQVPDEVLEPWLENDVERVLRVYTRTMSADVELARRFGRADMKDQVDAITASYERLFRRTPDGPEQKALSARLKRDVTDIEAMRDRIRGQYAVPTDPNALGWRVLRSMRTLNYLRLLGGMTVSAVPDLARVVLAGGGLGKTMTRGLMPMVANLRSFKMAASEVRMAGTALDMVLDTRAQQMADVFEDFGRTSKLERGLQYAGEKFGVVSGMSLWNATMKSFSGVMIQARMLKAITEAGASPAEIKRLRFLGLDGEMAQRIGKEFRKHGEKGGGVWVANTADWTDKEAGAAFRAALVKEVDSHVVSPGQEKPLWMSTELGKTIGQFKSFSFAAMNRQLIRGLQERDGAVAQSVVLGVALGMLTYHLKTTLAGKKTSDEPQKWIIEGLDRSGTLGWLMEGNNMLEKLSRNRLGINPAAGVDPAGRYVSRSPLEALLGPSAGLVNDAWTVGGATSAALVPDENGETKPMGRADIHKARRLLPLQNLFFMAWLFDGVEDATGDAAGLPERAED